MGISFSSNRRSNCRNAYCGTPLYPPPHPCPAHHPHLLPPPPFPPVNSYYAYPFQDRSVLAPYCPYHTHNWPGFHIPRPPPPPLGVPVANSPPPPYVEHRQSKKVESGVNVHKDSIKLEVDEQNPDHHLISFVFDALGDGSITILYFAKEEANCRFIPSCPEVYIPVNIPFQKGLGQIFRQPSGTGIDLGFFALNDLSEPSPEKDVYPLVISAEAYLPSHLTNACSGDTPPKVSFHVQANQAVLEKNCEEQFIVKVIRRILWVDSVRYELHEIYGIGNHTPDCDNSGSGKECVICMTEPKDTAVLPCRHMCMCNGCAKTLRLQSNRCPICRQHVEELLEIKIN